MLVSTLTYLLPVLVACQVAALPPLHPRQNLNVTPSEEGPPSPPPGSPTITISPHGNNSQSVAVTGYNEPEWGQDVFLGIPFAAPPIGDLRLTPPQAAMYNSTLDATTQPLACLQQPSYLMGQFGQSEDCLKLNVFKPEGTQYTDLPVMVWVYGGTFIEGTASTYNGSVLVKQSVDSGRPIVFVAIQYRLGIFGWPYGAEVAKNGAANLGLKDIISSLEWVQQNIRAFGGDPAKVTVAGQSAGAISISLLYLKEQQNLFRSAIMESGAQSTLPLGETAQGYNTVYQDVAYLTGCLAKANVSFNPNASDSESASNVTVQANDTTWQCIKSLPASNLLNASLAVSQLQAFEGAFLFGPSIDNDLIPASPHSLLQQGKFAKQPFISGNVLDEGTAFTPPTLNNETQLIALTTGLERFTPLNKTTLANLLVYYPNEADLGSPYNTGNETFGLSPVFKQSSAIVGDGAFQQSRRWFAQQAAQHGMANDTWSYLFTAKVPDTTPYNGVQHGSEIAYVFGTAQNTSTGYSQADATLSKAVIDYWLNFVCYTNPSPSSNSTSSSNTTHWPAYGSGRNMLQLDRGNISLISDTYRQKQIQYFWSEPQQFNLR